MPILGLLAALHGVLAAPPALVAVLPLNTREGALEPGAVRALEEAIRSIAADRLGLLGYTVLTGDNTLRLLADNGIDPARACDTTCALDTARELNASMFVSGTVVYTEGLYVGYIRLFHQPTGQQIASVMLEGDSVRQLREQFRKQAPGFFRAAKPPAVGTVVVDFRPSGSHKWTLLRRDGQLECTLPCTRPVTAMSKYVLRFDAQRLEDIASIPVPERLGRMDGERFEVVALAPRRTTGYAVASFAAILATGALTGALWPRAPDGRASNALAGTLISLPVALVVGTILAILDRQQPRLAVFRRDPID